MQAYQQYKLRMYRTVVSVCASNEGIVKTIPAFFNGLVSLKEQIDQLEKLEKIQASPTQGITKQKDKLKLELTELILIVSGGLHAYAVSIEDLELKKKSEFSSAIKLLHQSELLNISEMVQAEAVNHLSHISDFGVTNDSLSLLKTLTDQFRLVITKPTEARIDKSGATASIQETFKKADALLKGQLDKLALQFKKDAPDFYHIYKSSRNIEDRKARSIISTNIPATEMNRSVA